jgi:hypothetical protein
MYGKYLERCDLNVFKENISELPREPRRLTKNLSGQPVAGALRETFEVGTFESVTATPKKLIREDRSIIL